MYGIIQKSGMTDMREAELMEQQAVFHDIAVKCGIAAGIAAYILVILLASYGIFMIEKLVIRRKT